MLGGAWRGNDHATALEAAKEAGLAAEDLELELFLRGFKAGAILEDRDGSIVLRGRSPLSKAELERTFAPMLRYLGVPKDGAQVYESDGAFELRIAPRIAERAAPALGEAKLALQLWIGFGLLGLAVHQLFPAYRFVAAILWGIGLVLGATQLRRGMATGRANLAARLALGLAMLAKEKQLVLPPAGLDEGASSAGQGALPAGAADEAGDPGQP